jgi:peptidoglycan/LPS O-acetylase OafA/YrhL
MKLLAVDAVRAVCAQIIVWHHFVIYGPMARLVEPHWPVLVSWLDVEARKVVQVFLVLGGCMAAKAVGSGPPKSWRAGWSLLWRRGWRLARPLWAALAMVLLALGVGHALVGSSHAAWLPSWPSAAEVLANAFMLQDVLGLPSMSAGLWYVAIDFQLFVGAALLTLFFHRARWLMGVTVVLTVWVSAWFFNRDADRFDSLALYFMAAYGLGVLAWWTAQRQRGAVAALLAAGLGVVVALMIEPRDRLMLALVAAMALVGLLRMTLDGPASKRQAVAGQAVIEHLGASSYGLFLVHYPVLLIVTAVWVRFMPSTAWGAALGLGAAWALSMALSMTRWFTPKPAAGRQASGRAHLA